MKGKMAGRIRKENQKFFCMTTNKTIADLFEQDGDELIVTESPADDVDGDWILIEDKCKNPGVRRVAPPPLYCYPLTVDIQTDTGKDKEEEQI